MLAYELRFYREDGGLSALVVNNFASDRDAVAGARRLLSYKAPKGAVWQEGRLVANVTQVPPVMAA